MSRKNISQTQARTLMAQVRAMKEQRQRQLATWSGDYPDGVHIASVRILTVDYAKVTTAKRLGYTIVATSQNDDELRLYAVKS